MRDSIDSYVDRASRSHHMGLKSFDGRQKPLLPAHRYVNLTPVPARSRLRRVLREEDRALFPVNACGDAASAGRTGGGIHRLHPLVLPERGAPDAKLFVRVVADGMPREPLAFASRKFRLHNCLGKALDRTAPITRQSQ